MKPSDDKDKPAAGRSGLTIRHAPAKYPRPAAGVKPAAPVAAASGKLEPLAIDSHIGLLKHQQEIAARVAAHPDLSVMLLINPVLAFERLGIKLAPEISRHVLHTIQHPKPMRERRDALEASLTKALGEAPRPTEPAWNAHLLFALRKLAPLDIGKHVPAFLPPLGAGEQKKLDKLRPAAKVRYPQERKLTRRSRVSSEPWRESVRRLDLEHRAPALKHAKHAPREVPLEDLWFYKDVDPLVREALELGVIQRRAFPIHTPDSFRRILEGEKPNAFRRWIRSVRFKS